jgi:hypothetical protein
LKAPLLRLLTFLRLVDEHDRVVSLTSVCLWVVVGKLALTPSPTLPDIAALLLPLLASAHKRHLGGKLKQAGESVASAVQAAETAAKGAEEVKGALSAVQDQLAKHAETLSALRNRGTPGPGGR